MKYDFGCPSAENRREHIAKTHEILLYAGDNLKDFKNTFYSKGTDAKEQVDAQQQLFGVQFIMLPNSIYGSWRPKK